MPPSDSAGLPGTQQPQDTGSDFNAHAFLIQSLLNRIAISTLVKVVAVYGGGTAAAPGTVDVLPLVSQVDGAGNAMPHGVVHGLPFCRLQGGGNAVMLDPQAGDIGLAIFADHDISKVKATGAQALPGSARRFDMADGVYVCGLLGAAPSQYVAFAAGGITVTSPVKVTITAPTVAVEGNLTATGGITAGFGGSDSVTLQHHTHPSNGAPPTAGT